MNRASLLARTPFRTALALSGVLLVAAAIGTFVGARLLEAALTASLDVQVREHSVAVQEDYVGGGAPALVAIVIGHASVRRAPHTLYRLHASGGGVVVGEPGSELPPTGFSTLGSEAPGATRYRVLRQRIEDMDLVVGRSDAEIAGIRHRLYRVTAFATLATLLVVLGGGAWLGGRARRRLDRIDASLERAGGGELSARIPLSGRGDDIDRLAARVNAMLGELESLVSAVDQVSSDIAHDLKTPIARLYVSLEEALEEADAGRPVTDRLLDAQAELVDINATFEAMLRLSRIERRARRERFEEVALSALLGEVCEHWQPVAEDKGQTLALEDRTGGRSSISGDKDLLTQLVVNLLTNALGHSPPGARVKITLERSTTASLLRVADDGPGIPPDEREKVFRRLYRLDRSRSSPGHGLGLSLVRAIATLHGGTVTIDGNAPGTIVTVELPGPERTRTDTARVAP